LAGYSSVVEPVLHDFTDQDLEKIGVRSLGQRRKLLRRIADSARDRLDWRRDDPNARVSRLDAMVLQSVIAGIRKANYPPAME
jgi:hypothetical protein